ncbi:Tn3 family transposase (plasmid) [Enterobacter huaxiensis]|nr:Tn3 family transposase [Enterobacter huaxiensis]
MGSGAGNQSYRASGLTLLTTTMSPWNTVYIERTVDTLKLKGITINRQLLLICPSWDGST